MDKYLYPEFSVGYNYLFIYMRTADDLLGSTLRTKHDTNFDYEFDVLISVFLHDSLLMPTLGQTDVIDHPYMLGLQMHDDTMLQEIWSGVLTLTSETCEGNGTYSISQEICTRFCCALLCCGYVIVHNESKWSIYPYSSGLVCWHWGNRQIAAMPMK